MVRADIFKVDDAKCKEIVRIKRAYITGELTFDQARQYFFPVSIPYRPKNLRTVNSN
ncbi:hypothetical protein [Anaeroglobus geminatus]|uniref:Uncharacterized protein n=1 Tax=Anaeroglobus geminatus F0357 TaxID=861450 RepID=G9YJQ7_9FIRM|nr:hypothetical protein [Anaeroglobus geminatus]EHM38241.1 hypothetical protein HMPREF0080_01911 [Anaeroglobus geminatus F0357]